MTDIVLTPVTTGYNLSSINTNFKKLETSINTDTLHLSNGNNTMSQPIDMNGFAFLNYPVNPSDPNSLVLNQSLINEAVTRATADTDLNNKLTGLQAGINSGMIGYLTKAAMDADLNHPAGSVALVTNDPTTANNISYIKIGASGSGSWQASVDRQSLALGNASGFLQSGTGALLRNFQEKARENVSPLDFGAVGDGTTDDTLAVQRALNTGKSVELVSGKTYVVSGLTMTTNGQILFGGGILKKKAGVEGITLNISASNCMVFGIQTDGTASQPTVTTTANNDIIRITGNDNVITDCYINGSAGGGISIYNAARNFIKGNTVLNVLDNSILVANLGADDNEVDGNYCSGTTLQNCIFFSANTSTATGPNYIFRNKAINNLCKAAGDTALEIGYHNQGAICSGNYCTGTVAPPILVRDSIDVVVDGNIVEGQTSTVDGIAFVPQSETAAFPYRAVISNNVIKGKFSRSGIYIGGSSIKVVDNQVQDTVTAVNTSGSNLAGVGINIAGSLTDLEVKNNRVSSYAVALSTQLATATLTRFICQDNILFANGVGFDIRNTTFTDSVIRNNKVSQIVTFAWNMTGANGSLNSYWYDNINTVTGFTGGSPLEMNSTYSVQFSFLSDPYQRAASIPGTQFVSQILVPQNSISAGILTLEFATGEHSIFTVFLGGGVGDGAGYASIHTHAAINMVTSGSSDWGITKASGSGIILQRRGSTIASPGLMKWSFRPSTIYNNAFV